MVIAVLRGLDEKNCTLGVSCVSWRDIVGAGRLDHLERDGGNRDGNRLDVLLAPPRVDDHDFVGARFGRIDGRDRSRHRAERARQE